MTEKVYRRYNFPWSGRLGRLTNVCIYCGKNDSSFRLSSFGDHCLKPECRERASRGDWNPELKQRMDEQYENSAIEWCKKRGIDYAATVAAIEARYGDIWGELADFAQEDVDKCIVLLGS